MRGIEKLHPSVRAKAERLLAICKEADLPLLITDTLRTKEEQDKLYAQGRTAPGLIVSWAKGSDYESPHQWGLAFDFCKNVKGGEWIDSKFFGTIGELGESIGLEWGGRWVKKPDRPHLQDKDFDWKTLKAKYGTPDKFFGAWQ